MSQVSASTPSLHLPVSDQLIRATARIECTSATGKNARGTCFFFLAELDGGKQAPLLITNKHVIKGQSKAAIHLTTRPADEPAAQPEVMPFEIQALQPLAIYHPSPNVDLAAIAFGPVAQVLRHGGKVAEYVTLRSADIISEHVLGDCRAFEDLLMIGYPNGIWDRVNNRPIVRRASSATPIFENYNGEAKFLIDCACFPGSSGSPVFLFNEGIYSTKKGATLGGTRVALVGVLHAAFLHLTKGQVVEADVASIQQLEAEVTVPNSIGICIKAAEINGLVGELMAKIGQSAAA